MAIQLHWDALTGPAVHTVGTRACSTCSHTGAAARRTAALSPRRPRLSCECSIGAAPDRAGGAVLLLLTAETEHTLHLHLRPTASVSQNTSSVSQNNSSVSQNTSSVSQNKRCTCRGPRARTHTSTPPRQCHRQSPRPAPPLSDKPRSRAATCRTSAGARSAAAWCISSGCKTLCGAASPPWKTATGATGCRRSRTAVFSLRIGPASASLSCAPLSFFAPLAANWPRPSVYELRAYLRDLRLRVSDHE